MKVKLGEVVKIEVITAEKLNKSIEYGIITRKLPGNKVTIDFLNFASDFTEEELIEIKILPKSVRAKIKRIKALYNIKEEL